MENIENAIFEGLNAEQRQAVSEMDGPVLIVAGAGSGKTRVLTSRIAFALSKGVDPSRILALTFTKKAATEMKERIARMVGGRMAWKLCMGTFHSVFVKFLREYAGSLGYPSSFTIYDQSDSTSAIKACVKELGLDDKVYKPRDILSRISLAKNNLVTATAYRNNRQAVEKDIASRKPRICDIYSLYADKCRRSGVMDFDDILLNMNILLRDNPEALESISSRFDYILVDEYQDTNYAQYVILKKLSAARRDICVVGDDSQSIYAFRGAKIENILNFKKDYPECKLFRLEKNYRSTANIVEAANSLIEKNQGRIPKNCVAVGDTGDKIRLMRSFSEQEEALMICSEIVSRMMTDHAKYQDFAILYRTNSQSRIIEKAMVKANIPHMVIGGLKFFEREEIKNALAYINLVIDHDDNISLSRIINVPSRKIGKVTLEKIAEISVQHGVSLFEACKLYQNVSKSKELKKFIELINELTEELDRNTLKDFEWVSLLLEKTGLMEYYRKVDEKENKAENSRCDNLDELIRAFGESKIEYDPNIDFPQTEDILNQEESNLSIRDTIADFVRTAASSDVVNISTGDSDTDSSYVSLMTIHSAKGLEFPCVIVAGFEKGLIPLGFNDFNMNAGRNDEERRLAYVAITRAKNHLFLMYCQRRSVIKFGSFYDQDTGPSEFLQDLSKGNYELKALRIR